MTQRCTDNVCVLRQDKLVRFYSHWSGNAYQYTFLIAQLSRRPLGAKCMLEEAYLWYKNDVRLLISEWFLLVPALNRQVRPALVQTTSISICEVNLDRSLRIHLIQIWRRLTNRRHTLRMWWRVIVKQCWAPPLSRQVYPRSVASLKAGVFVICSSTSDCDSIWYHGKLVLFKKKQKDMGYWMADVTCMFSYK